ncbi:MAG: hypothetical protein ABJ051_10065 [Lentilitoribacter sp.]
MRSVSVTVCDHCGADVSSDEGRRDKRFCSNKCRQADYRRRKKVSQKPVEALVHGDNADLIKTVASLYAKDTDLKIADVTYGKGVFWRKCPHLDVTGSDLVTVPERSYDFRNLPYEDKSFDIVVLDPPYVHSPGNHMTDANYQNAQTTKGHLYDDIMKLYRDGMKEASRVARRQIWVKCKDQVQAGQQCWAHIDILNEATKLGMRGRDFFTLIPTARTPNGRWTIQHHARKPMSYLWVLDVA